MLCQSDKPSIIRKLLTSFDGRYIHHLVLVLNINTPAGGMLFGVSGLLLFIIIIKY